MAIRDFATDGAFGAAGASDNSGAIPTGGYQADDGGMNGNASGANDGGYSYTNSPGVSGFDYAHLGHYFQNAGQANSFDDNQSLAANPRNEMITNNDADYWSKFNAAAANQDNRTAMFEGGGSVDGGDGDGSSDVGSLLALALSSVDAGLNYGRQKYGLSQDKGQQQAAMGRTPAIPGNQSESGMPRPQPMPGPLPPTSNPFGQRRLGQNDQDQDDQGTQTAQAGAIPDNDEDDQEGTA